MSKKNGKGMDSGDNFKVRDLEMAPGAGAAPDRVGREPDAGADGAPGEVPEDQASEGPCALPAAST